MRHRHLIGTRQLRHDSIVRFIGFAKLYNVPNTKPTAARAGTRSSSRLQLQIHLHSGSNHDARDDDTPFREFCIVTEFCKYGDLSDYMQTHAKPSLQKQLTLMYDIAFGCSYLHGRRPAIIHRDLKSLNILVGEDERAKISDFGLAKIKSKARVMMHTVVGTPNWQAPEVKPSEWEWEWERKRERERAGGPPPPTPYPLRNVLLCLW